MPRIVPLLIAVAACWLASASSVASAQLPRCNAREIATIVRKGGSFPDVRGCNSADIQKVARSFDYRVNVTTDDSVTGIRRGIITRSAQRDGVVYLLVSSGRGDQPPPLPPIELPPATPPIDQPPKVIAQIPKKRRPPVIAEAPPVSPASPTQVCPDGTQIPITETCRDVSQEPVVTSPPLVPAAVPPPAPPPPLPPPTAPKPPTPKPAPAPPANPECNLQMAFFRPPHFSIIAPTQVREGDPLTVTVHSDRKECRPHKIALAVDPAELLAGQPQPIDFPPQGTAKSVTIATAKGQPGDGDQSLTISLRTGNDAAVGDPGSVTVKILDTPKTIETPPTPTYSISASQNVARGQVLRFEVRKSGPTTPSRLEYAFRQGKDLISPDGLQHPLEFAEGEARKTLELRGDRYAKCGLAPTLMLRGPAGLEAQASATFSADRCTILESLNERAPWWPIPAAAVAALLGFGLWQMGKKLFNGGSPTFYSKWDLKADLPAGEF